MNDKSIKDNVADVIGISIGMFIKILVISYSIKLSIDWFWSDYFVTLVTLLK